MSFRAANPAALDSQSPCAIERAYDPAKTCDDRGDSPSPFGLLGHARAAAISAKFRSQGADENFDPVCVCRYVSRLLLGHCFGAIPAPCGTASLCFGYAVFQVMVPP
jgi:hypothetical protein